MPSNRKKDLSRLECNVEELEKRQMLAGSVRATITGAGNLVITGDGNDNDISVYLSEVGEVTIFANDGEDLDLTGIGVDGVFGDSQVTGNVTIRMRGGDDYVGLNGDGFVGEERDPPTVDRINVSGGGGSDYLSVRYINANGNLTVNSGRGSYDYARVLVASVSGNVAVTGGTAYLGFVSAEDIRIRGSQVTAFYLDSSDDVSISTGGGVDSVTVVGSEVTGTLSVNTGGNSYDDYIGDRAYIKYNNVGDLSVNMGGGRGDGLYIDNVISSNGGTLNGGGGTGDFLDIVDSPPLTNRGFEYV